MHAVANCTFDILITLTNNMIFECTCNMCNALVLLHTFHNQWVRTLLCGKTCSFEYWWSIDLKATTGYKLAS